MSMAVSDRMVLLARVLAIFVVDTALGLAASAFSSAAAGLALGWLIPMTAVSGLALSVAVVTRSANVGVAAGTGLWAIAVLGGQAVAGQPAGRGQLSLALPALPGSSPLCCATLVMIRGPSIRGDQREYRDHRPDPAVRAHDGGRRREPAAGPGVFGLLGPNGAGKTTLLRTMATVIQPTAGTVRLLGRDPGVSAATGNPAQARAICRRRSATTRASPSRSSSSTSHC